MVKALLFSSSFGDGHRQVASALQSAFAKRGVATVEVDCFRGTNPILAALLETTYKWVTRYGARIYGMLYRGTARFGPHSKLWKLLSISSKSAAVAAIERHQPDIVLQLFPDHSVAALPRRLRRPYIGVVLTDYSIHGHWFHENVDTYFVPHEELVSAAETFVSDPSQLVATGIPIRERFYSDTGRPATEGMTQPYIVFATGGRGLFPDVIRAVEVAANSLPDYHVYVMCGRNTVMYQAVDEIARRLARVQALPYVEDVNVWFRGAAFAVIKAGGVTVTECLATACPMVLYRPQPGQEADNASFLQRTGAANIVLNLKEFEETVKNMRSSSKRLAMSETCRDMARSDAANRVVEHVLHHIGYDN